MEKVISLLKDFEGSMLNEIERCEAEKDLDILFAKFDEKQKSVKVLLNSLESEQLNKVYSCVVKNITIKRQSIKNNNRLENIKKILFD